MGRTDLETGDEMRERPSSTNQIVGPSFGQGLLVPGAVP